MRCSRHFIYFLLSIGLLVLFTIAGCAPKVIKLDATFRITVNNAVTDAIHNLPQGLLDVNDKVVIIALEQGKNELDRDYFQLVKQGILSGLSSRALCQEKTITKPFLSQHTTTFPLDEKEILKLQDDLEATKILAYRPSRYLNLRDTNLTKVQLYVRLIELVEVSERKIMPKVVWSGILHGMSQKPTADDQVKINKTEYNLYVRVHNAAVDATRSVFGKVGFDGIFVQPMGDYTATFSGQNALEAQKTLILKNLETSLAKYGKNKKCGSLNIDNLFMAVEEGIISGFSSKPEGFIIEKAKIPAFRFANQFRVLVHYSSPFQFISWPLLREMTNAKYVLFYRPLQIESDEATTVRLYMRLMDLYKGKVLWSGVASGVSGNATLESERYKKALNNLASMQLHRIAYNAASNIAQHPFKEQDHVIVLNVSKSARNLEYNEINSNTLAIEDGIISGLCNAFRKKSKASVVDKIHGLYVLKKPTAYYLTREFLEPIHKTHTNITKLVTFDVLQLNYEDGSYVDKIPSEYFLKKRIDSIQIEVNMIDIAKGAMVYSSILGPK